MSLNNQTPSAIVAPATQAAEPQRERWVDPRAAIRPFIHQLRDARRAQAALQRESHTLRSDSDQGVQAAAQKASAKRRPELRSRHLLEAFLRGQEYRCLESHGASGQDGGRDVSEGVLTDRAARRKAAVRVAVNLLAAACEADTTLPERLHECGVLLTPAPADAIKRDQAFQAALETWITGA